MTVSKKDKQDQLHQVILIIDGHPVYIHKVEGFLEGLTFRRIFLTTAGSQGLKIVQDEKPDLVILSGMLPDMDSFEVCRKIKTSFPKTKIIVQIGLFTDEGSIAKFKEFGADYVLPRMEKDLHPLQEAVEDLVCSS